MAEDLDGGQGQGSEDQDDNEGRLAAADRLEEGYQDQHAGIERQAENDLKNE